MSTPPSPRTSTQLPTADELHDVLRAREDCAPEDRSHNLGPLGIALHHPQEFYNRRKSSVRRSSERRRKSSLVIQRVNTGRTWWRFTLRDLDSDEPEDWWFASTAIPLLAATIGPLANVLSIAALVTSWRMCLVTGVDTGLAQQCQWDGDRAALGPQLTGQDFADPRWCYWLNVVSLVAGFIGNFFLLCNFTNRIRYIIALPVTIVMWYIATGILLGITVSMQIYVPPIQPQQTYTQGFWYAVIAACMYMICAMLLMVNMLGYFLGHYPQHFTLTDSQRTLILQTMLFFVWLAGGGAVFSRVETLHGSAVDEWSYVDALYFCDVTILTVVFPYSVGGIIMLGLMVSSITKFAGELGSEKVIRRHIERSRTRTVGRTVTTSLELENRKSLLKGERPVISAPFDPVEKPNRTRIAFAEERGGTKNQNSNRIGALRKVGSWVTPSIRRPGRKPKLLLLREEKDRFDAMRRIQSNTTKFKNWYALSISVAAFGLLWCGGAVVFWRCEHEVQGMSYFQALYFCYVSLLTIGYGDLAPKSNAGRPFFVFWSLIAVPTMTILVADLGDTVINKFKRGTFRVADFTVLPQKGVWRDFLNKHERLLDWLQQRKNRKDVQRRLEQGFQYGPDPDTPGAIPTLDELAEEEPTEQELARKLTDVIRRVADDIKAGRNRRYSYEEWVEFTQLIRFTANEKRKWEIEDGGHLIQWDWIGEDSPMMAQKSEAEFVLDRLCESMDRFVKRIFKLLPSEDGKSEPLRARKGRRRERDGGDDNDSDGDLDDSYQREVFEHTSRQVDTS